MSRREWAWVVVAVGLCLTLLASRLLPYDVFLALIGVLIGAVISGAISWYIYQRSSAELRIEAEKLRKLHRATLSIMPMISGGKVKVIWNEHGDFERLEYLTPIADSVDVTDSVQTKLEKDKDRDPGP
jgi:uncharacterized membrane protein YccC